MKNFNNEIKSVKGISIIALVITIVVLIILAGVAINMTIRQNGVLTKAKLSQQKYQNSQKEEESILENMTDEINKGTSNSNISEERIRQMIREEINNRSISVYPTGTPVVLDSTSGELSKEKNITAPGDGWIVIDVIPNGSNGVHYTLKVGNLYDNKTDGNVWLNLKGSLPCKTGETIQYRWWGRSCKEGYITFIPQQ